MTEVRGLSKWLVSVLLVVVLVASSLVGSVAQAQPPLDGGGGWTNYPDPDENSGIAGQAADGEIASVPAVWTSLADVASAFNNARGIENADICPAGVCQPVAQVMPTTVSFPAAYSTWSPAEKGLWLLNQERTARGLLPFEGVDASLQQVSQAWAQNLIDTDTFSHNPNVIAEVEAICAGCVGNIGAFAAENLAWRAGFPTLPQSEFGVEKALYAWMYVDRGAVDQRWGHRHALLWNNLSNDHGSAGSEGFIGFGLVDAPTAGGEQQMVVFNAIDSNVNYPAPTATPGYVALAAPCPAFDSTTATGASGGTFVGGETRVLKLTGVLPASQGTGTPTCIPAAASVSSAIVTITAKNPQAAGNLRLSAAGVTPNGGVVNYANNGLNNTNTVTVPVSAAGEVQVTANGGPAGLNLSSTDVRIAVIGYFTTSGSRYTAVTPCAAADSRASQGGLNAFQGPFGPGAPYPDVDVVGTFSADQGGGNSVAGCGIPASATAVVANLVAVNPTGAAGTLSAGTGATDPAEPLVAFAPIGMSNAALVVVPLDGQEAIAIDIDGAVGASSEIRVVVLGYFSDASTTQFTAVSPCAVFDTRTGTGPLLGARDGGSTTTYLVTGNALPVGQGGGHGGTCGVPAGATAVVINLVAVNSATAGNLRVYATGTVPEGGVLNFDALTPAMNNSNGVIVPISGAGQLNVDVNTGATNVVGATGIRGVIYGYFSG